jgi:leader peptidase (prepilin peptidase)/N-methyltransferase
VRLVLAEEGTHAPTLDVDMSPLGALALAAGGLAMAPVCWALAGREVGHPLSGRTKAAAGVALGVTAAVAGWRSSAPLAALATACALAASVVIALVDVADYRIPNRIVFPALGLSAALFVAQGLVDGGPAARALAGGALFYGILGAIFVISPGKMGYGDVKFAALLGLPLGWQTLLAVPVALVVSSVVGIVIHGVLVAGGRRAWRDMLPFGVYLAVGTTVTVVIGGAALTSLFRGS